MITIQYLADRDAIAIAGVPLPVTAGSLQVRRLGDLLAVASPHQDTLVCAWAPFDAWMRPDGTGFASADEAYAYLIDVTTRRVPGSQVALTAGDVIGGQRALMLDEAGLAVHADPDAEEYAFAGISTGAAVAGASLQAIVSGVLTEPSWSWTPRQPVYAGLDGALTQDPPTTGWFHILGTAQSATALLVAPQPPVRLAP